MKKYNTNAKAEIEEYLYQMKGHHLTIKDIANHFKDEDIKVGQTTIYRKVEELVQEGVVKKYILGENNSASFEYVEKDLAAEDQGYHLKCEHCGKLIHFQCSQAAKFWEHLAEEHQFQIDMQQTVIYGVCQICSNAGDIHSPEESNHNR